MTLSAAYRPSADVDRRRRAFWRRVVRFAFFLFGLGLAAKIIVDVGATSVGQTLGRTGPWIVVFLACELATLTFDMLGVSALLGDAASRVPRSTWVRAAVVAYVSGVLLPAGRAAGEAARGTVLAPVVGAARATAACSRSQACALAGNAIISFVATGVLLIAGVTGKVALAILTNGLVCGALGALIFVVARSARVADWLRRRFPKLASAETVSAEEVGLCRAVGFNFAGRVVQTFEFGLILAAVGATPSVVRAFTAQAIHLVGSALGDAIPGQVGATEGAFQVFAAAVGLGSDPARAVSIAIVTRLAQVAFAVVCLLVALFVRPRAASLGDVPAGEAVHASSARPDAIG